MKLNERLLRARRMELGLTTREVARRAKVSQAVIARLERTGDVAVLQVGTLSTILAALALDLVDALAKPEVPTTSEEAVAEVGALLHERGRSVQAHDVAMTLGLTLEQAKDALAALDERLRGAGLRTHKSSSGFAIVPIVRPESGSGSDRERARYLANLNRGDMDLLHRVLTGRVPANSVAASNNGTVCLRRLEGAGMLMVEANELKLTERARTALGLTCTDA